MIYDKFGNVIYQSKDLLDLFYKGQLDFNNIFVEPSDDIKKFEDSTNTTLKKLDPTIYDISIKDFDSAMQSDWLVPDEYKNMDIEGFLVNE